MKNSNSSTLGSSRLYYEIREIMPQDILTGGFLEAIENLAVQVADVRRALGYLRFHEVNFYIFCYDKQHIYKSRTNGKYALLSLTGCA